MNSFLMVFMVFLLIYSLIPSNFLCFKYLVSHGDEVTESYSYLFLALLFLCFWSLIRNDINWDTDDNVMYEILINEVLLNGFHDLFS